MYQVEKTGFLPVNLTFDGNVVILGKEYIGMKMGGLDHSPEGVAEVRLLSPKQTHLQGRVDGALIKVSSHTPIQEFVGPRQFIESTSDELIWVGRTPDGETFTYNPREVAMLKRHSETKGCLKYGQGWVGSWINLAKNPSELLEICVPMFENDGSVIEHEVDSPAIDLWYWKMWHAVADND